MTATDTFASTLRDAEVGINAYLDDALAQGRIDRQLYDEAVRNTLPNLEQWLEDRHIDSISPRLKEGIRQAV
ncbi:MAG: hypothetical protein O7B26_05295, partial [Planctomycetota bacterium]|nr:hypothetical protein [Planctomycetota bacterium]